MVVPVFAGLLQDTDRGLSLVNAELTRVGVGRDGGLNGVWCCHGGLCKTIVERW